MSLFNVIERIRLCHLLTVQDTRYSTSPSAVASRWLAERENKRKGDEEKRGRESFYNAGIFFTNKDSRPPFSPWFATYSIHPPPSTRSPS